MDGNIIELVKLGHELAKELHCAESAALVSDLATQLDVQFARSNALAAERDIVNADNAYLRDQVICWARECDRITFTHTNKITDAHQMEAEQELANTTPATEAFLAEVQASAIDNFVDIKTKQLADMHPDTHAFGATTMSIRSQINELQVFAAQLRKGVQS